MRSKNKQIMFVLTLLLAFITQSIQAQTKIGGKILMPDGTPAIGVVISVKDTKTAVVSDFDGNYSIKITDPNQVLQFSFLGHKTVEMPVGSQTSIDVKLEEDVREVEEVVVVGYGTQKKSDLTGSVAMVSTKDMKNSSIQSADQAMQGRAAGVVVINNSGAPGAGVTIKVRGTSGMGSSDPLYVVDGMPIKDATFGTNEANPTGISYLNPNDIESIQVLKDASSAAIYGTRGANGVVLITTKRGKSEQMKVEIESYVGLQELGKKINMLNSQQFATMWNEVKSQMPDAASTLYNPDEIAGLRTTNWVKSVTREAIVHNSQVSISGGKNGNNYYFSANNYKQDGIIRNSTYDRQSIRINSDNKINKWLKFGESLTLMQSNQDQQGGSANGGIIMEALRANPTAPVFAAPGVFADVPKTKKNIRGVLERTYNKTLNYRMQGSLYLELELLKNLKYKVNLGLDRSWGVKKGFTPKYFLNSEDANLYNDYLLSQTTWNNWLIEHTLAYNLELGKSKFDFLAGYTSQYEIKDNNTVTARLTTDTPNDLYLNNKDEKENASVKGDAIEWALISQLGRINYTYDDKYLFTGTVRRDGSSRFGSGKKYGVFPSWSLAWKVSSEEFFKNSSFLSSINLLKLRGGWGRVGNQNIVPYAYNGSVSATPGKTDGVNASIATAVLGTSKTVYAGWAEKTRANPNVGWETSTTINGGFDMSFWKEKLSMSFDVYDKYTTDLLMPMPMPMYLGYLAPDFGKPYINKGEISNKGIEYSLSYRKYEGAFNYEVSGNISKNYNKVIKLNGSTIENIGNETVVREGIPLGTFYGRIVEGIYQNQEDIDNHAKQDRVIPGDFKIKDLNNDGIIDETDRTYIGNAIPSFVYGLTLNMSFKGFDLNIFTQGVQGNMVYNKMRQNALHDFEFRYNVSTDLLKYWGRTMPDGSKLTNTSIPRLGVDNANNKKFSDYFLEDASYFRIKSITLGYTFKKSWVEKMKVSNIRIYTTVQNIYTFTKYTGFDPEIGKSGDDNLNIGLDNGSYPIPRMYMVGLNFSF